MPEVGRLAICLALLCAAYSIGAAVGGGVSRRLHWTRSAEHAAYAVFALVTVATAILLRALLQHDFSLEYVAAYSSSTLPTQYVVAALWGGQKGSLLFWSFMLTLFSTIVHWQNRERNRALMPWVTATLMVIALFFLALLTFVTDPFERLPVAAREGQDLNPLLQNYWMMIHPPSLYTGYVSASVPFAFAIAALASGQLGDQWIRTVRRWALFSWAFLALGNLLGARWAYEVLGWGGYWAWDPVENAAFMPWLVSTAYLHSVMIQEKKDMLRVWNMVLVLLTFALTIFGTFLTRSGVISSVHAFASGAIGPFLLAYLAAILLTSLGLLVWRWDRLGERAELDALLSRESVFLVNNVLLVAFCFTVFMGTIFPLLAEAVTGAKVSVGTPYFNWVSVPILLVTLLLMGVGPLVPWRRGSWAVLGRLVQGAAAIALGASLLTWLVGGLPLGLVGLGYTLPYFVAAIVLGELWRAARGRRRATGESWPRAVGRLLAQNHRRYGGLIVHLGVVLVAIGVATSTVGKLEREATLRKGETLELGRYAVGFTGLSATEQRTHLLVQAALQVSEAGRPTGTLRPGQRLYPGSSSPFASVAVRYGFFRDFYVILGAFDRQGEWAQIKAQVHPMVAWIWLGGVVVLLGGGLALWPAGRRVPATVPAAARAAIAGGADPGPSRD
jgi:cytochrome c-type biogenesis protein CcmF